MARKTKSNPVKPVCPECGADGYIISAELCWVDFPVLVDPDTGEIDDYGNPQFNEGAIEQHLRCQSCGDIIDEDDLRP